MQDVVEATEATASFNHRLISRLFDHANDIRVAPRVETGLARVVFRGHAATSATLKFVFEFAQRVCQGQNFFPWSIQQVVCHPFGTFGPQAGQLPEHFLHPAQHRGRRDRFPPACHKKSPGFIRSRHSASALYPRF
jgi:hypothetical protein